MDTTEKYIVSRRIICVLILFLLLLAIDTWHHEPWGDELHAWGLVLNNTNIASLFDALHYEGHPGLWHFLLRGAALLSNDTATPKILHFAIAASLLVMIAIAPGLSFVERLLLYANYYSIFEYTVMARNYGIAMLLGLIYAQVRTATRQHPVIALALLGAIANTNIYAGFLAGTLALEYTAATWKRPKNIATGLAVFCALGLLAAATIWPAADISHHAHQPMLGTRDDLERLGLQLLQTAVAPFVPIDLSFPESFAFPGQLFANGLRVWAFALLLPCIAAGLWTIFRDRPRFLAVLAGLIALAAGFAFLVYPSAIRHVGVVFVGFVVLLSIHRTLPPEPGTQPHSAAGLAVLGLLALGAVGGGTALAGQWMRPFSIDGAAARWLTDHSPPNAALVGIEDIRTEPIAILLGRRFYALDCRCEDSYVRFLNRRDGFRDVTIPERLEEAVRLYRPRPIVLLVGAPIAAPIRAAIEARGLMLTESIHLAGAERDRDITIFRVTEQ
ncbi:MAG: hypothetical protein WCI94_02400 [Rhodospirillales bacterium]